MERILGKFVKYNDRCGLVIEIPNERVALIRSCFNFCYTVYWHNEICGLEKVEVITKEEYDHYCNMVESGNEFINW